MTPLEQHLRGMASHVYINCDLQLSEALTNHHILFNHSFVPPSSPLSLPLPSVTTSLSLFLPSSRTLPSFDSLGSPPFLSFVGTMPSGGAVHGDCHSMKSCTVWIVRQSCSKQGDLMLLLLCVCHALVQYCIGVLLHCCATWCNKLTDMAFTN